MHGPMRRYSLLLLILVLLGSLAVSQGALAATTASPPAPTTTPQSHAAAEPEEEGELGEEEFEAEGEFELEECRATAGKIEFSQMEEAEEEEFEAEVEACEEAAEKGKKKSEGQAPSFVTAPAECLVQRAESTITTLPDTDRLLLTVHYKNYSSAAVAIELRLKDQKGVLGLGQTTKHLGRNGILHLTTKLGESEMDRAGKAQEFDIALRAADTPGYCSDLLEQHLKTKQSAAKAHGSRVYGS
jgi:hypothetical protein